MKQVRLPEVDHVCVDAKEVRRLVTAGDREDRAQWDFALNTAVDSLLESWEALLAHLQTLSRQSARKGETLSVERLDLRGVLGDISAAAGALNSAWLNLQWTYAGQLPSAQPADANDFHTVGFITLKRDFNKFLEQLVRSERIMHDHREILRALA